MIFSENKQLFGFDGMERIVAVEFSVPNQIDIFVREPDGSTAIRREEFSPFLWTSSAGIPLEGALTFDQLMTFPDWRSYQEARSRLAKEGTPLFAFNDPVQQYLTVIRSPPLFLAIATAGSKFCSWRASLRKLSAPLLKLSPL